MTLKEAFDRLNLALLNGWVGDGRQEDLHLEFKRLTSIGRKLSDDDKRNFAKALSGFANSDGGILVWGVNSRKNADGVDVACGLLPIADAKRWVSCFQSMTGEAVAPIVDEIEHRVIQGDAAGDFIATIVPP